MNEQNHLRPEEEAIQDLLISRHLDLSKIFLAIQPSTQMTFWTDTLMTLQPPNLHIEFHNC